MNHKELDKKTTNKLSNIKGDNTYYPSKQMLQQFSKLFPEENKGKAIVPGMIARTDKFDVDGTITNLENMIKEKNDNDPEKKNMENLLSRLISVSDLTQLLYERLADNKNSMYNWFDQLNKSIIKNDTLFKIPNTKIWRLPIELAQFIRLEYHETTPEDKALFNEIIFDFFELEDERTYFIKTGVFSSKFQFANAKCSEPREMGEYFSVINNFAMEIGAGNTIDLVVREYIEDVEDNPTIYNGMPLRTEFRAFVDFDTNEIIGIVPYWNPIVMKRALQMGITPEMEKDYQTYLKHEYKLMDEYNEYLPKVRSELKKIIPDIDLDGQYSVDIMKNGDDLYIIDLALMSESALTELL